MSQCVWSSETPEKLIRQCAVSLLASYTISPSRGSTRNIKKLEDRKTDPLSLEGYVSSSLPKPPEKGKGGCLPWWDPCGCCLREFISSL
jgi:hypothetical protein